MFRDVVLFNAGKLFWTLLDYQISHRESWSSTQLHCIAQDMFMAFYFNLERRHTKNVRYPQVVSYFPTKTIPSLRASAITIIMMCLSVPWRRKHFFLLHTWKPSVTPSQIDQPTVLCAYQRSICSVCNSHIASEITHLRNCSLHTTNPCNQTKTT